jgi:putative transposase
VASLAIRYDPRDLADLRVYFGDSFLCRAITPELAGETIALKDIIRARNRRRRELRTTLAEREATVEALLRLRRGEELRAEPEPLFPEPDPATTTPPSRPRLKSYFNE